MKRILIIQTAYLGDVVLATALAEALHASQPGASIDFLIRKGAEGLLNGHPFLGRIMTFDKKGGRAGQLFRLLGQIRAMRYDLVVNCHRFASSGFLAAFSGAKVVSGFRKNPFSRFYHYRYPHEIGNGMHEIDRNALLISFLPHTVRFLPKLYPPANNSPGIKPYVCIAPASVWFTKQWPEHKWVELIKTLPASYTVYLLGSGADIALCDRIRIAAGKEQVINYAGQMNLLQSAGFMKDAEMNYVNDSAPLHLCSAVNAPVKAIFCSTIPGFGFGPLSDSAQIIEIEQPLYCRPCGLHGFKACPEGHFRCAEEINVKKVI